MPNMDKKDPFAPPPMHHDRSGGFLRIVILVALLGLVVWGYTEFSQREQTALVPDITQEELADADGYQVSPSTLPEGASESLTSDPNVSEPGREDAPAG